MTLQDQKRELDCRKPACISQPTTSLKAYSHANRNINFYNTLFYTSSVVILLVPEAPIM